MNVSFKEFFDFIEVNEQKSNFKLSVRFVANHFIDKNFKSRDFIVWKN